MPDESGFVMAVTGGQFGQQNSNIYRFDFSTNKLTQLTNFSNDFAGGLTVAPDGKEIVFEFADDPGDPPQLWIMNINGSNRRPLGIQGESPDWRPGTGLEFTDRVIMTAVMTR